MFEKKKPLYLLLSGQGRGNLEKLRECLKNETGTNVTKTQAVEISLADSLRLHLKRVRKLSQEGSQTANPQEKE